jgi:LysR family transcriptional regulator, nitrogen assimilation regulatory protein
MPNWHRFAGCFPASWLSWVLAAPCMRRNEGALSGKSTTGVSMELRRLRNFLRIAAEGSLGKASHALGVAQPALGRQMQMLEAELGVKLFKRVSKGMRLTDEGEYLKEALEYPLQLLNNALRNVRSYGVRVEASLVLGLPPVIAQVFGPRVLSRLQRDLPNLRLTIAEGDSGKLAAELARGRVDIALLIGIFPADKVFHCEVLSEALMLVAPPGSLVAKRKSVAFSELPDFPLILPGAESSLRTQLAKAELAGAINLNIGLEIDSTELAKQAVLANLGYAILPLVAFKAEAERVELVGIPIADPAIDQIIRFAVRPLWRVPRSTYDQVERAIFEEWSRAVSCGEWPAKWLMDLNQVPSIRNRSKD